MIETCAMSEGTNTGHSSVYGPPSSMTWLMQNSFLCHGFSTLICACKFASLFSSLSVVLPSACSPSLPFPSLPFTLHMPKLCSTLEARLIPQTKYLQCHKVSHQNTTATESTRQTESLCLCSFSIRTYLTCPMMAMNLRLARTLEKGRIPLHC